MNKNSNHKKHIDFLFIIGRIYKLGNKDIDHMLPFLYFLSKCKNLEYTAKVFVYGDKHTFNYKNPLQNFLSNLKNVEIKYLRNDNFSSRLKKFLNLKSNSKFATIFNKLLTNLYVKLEKKNWNEDVNWKGLFGENFINSKNLIIATLQPNNKNKNIFLSIKKINKKLRWGIVPEGTILCDNKLVTIKDLDKKEEDTIKINNQLLGKKEYAKDVDYLFVTSKRELNDAITKGADSKKVRVIGSPRYCKEWLNIKSKFKLDGKDVKVNKGYKVKALFLIPKQFINIFNEELIRTIDFISSYKEIELILLNNNSTYPKIPSYIANRINIRHYLVAKQYSTSKLIEWADIVFHAGTGVIFESFMKEKITVLPRYLSSNTLISDKYNAGINLSNRDELRNLCNAAITSIDDLKKKYKKETYFSNKKFINDYVNGNLKSVPKKIHKKIFEICNNFKILKKL